MLDLSLKRAARHVFEYALDDADDFRAVFGFVFLKKRSCEIALVKPHHKAAVRFALRVPAEIEEPVAALMFELQQRFFQQRQASG